MIMEVTLKAKAVCDPPSRLMREERLLPFLVHNTEWEQHLFDHKTSLSRATLVELVRYQSSCEYDPTKAFADARQATSWTKRWRDESRQGTRG